MSRVAAIVGQDVVNVMWFDDDSIIEDFDYESLYGEGAYGLMITDEQNVSPGDLYIDGHFEKGPSNQPSHEDIMRQAAVERLNRIGQGQTLFSDWQYKVLLLRANEQEQEVIEKWEEYFDALNAVDPWKAPDITWPEQPPIPQVSS